MTSPRFNERKRQMRIYDELPAPLRRAIDEAPGSARPSVVLDALLRGVPQARIIETILKPRSPKP